MMSAVRTMVIFKSRAFNTSESKSYFINPCCFGDDLCRWLLQRLRSRGIPTSDEPGQEDFGWYFTFECGSQSYCFVFSYQSADEAHEGQWIGEVERHVGFLASLLGRRKRGIQPEAVQAIHAALASSAVVQQVRWHFACAFTAGTEDD